MKLQAGCQSGYDRDRCQNGPFLFYFCNGLFWRWKLSHRIEYPIECWNGPFSPCDQWNWAILVIFWPEKLSIFRLWWTESKKPLPNAWCTWKRLWLANHQLEKFQNTLIDWAQFSWMLFTIFLLENAKQEMLCHLHTEREELTTTKLTLNSMHSWLVR